MKNPLINTVGAFDHLSAKASDLLISATGNYFAAASWLVSEIIWLVGVTILSLALLFYFLLSPISPTPIADGFTVVLDIYRTWDTPVAVSADFAEMLIKGPQ